MPRVKKQEITEAPDRNLSRQEPEPKLRKRKGQPAVWEARYRVYTSDGTAQRPRETFGTEAEFATKAALKSSHQWDVFIKKINVVRSVLTFSDLARVYREEHIERNLRPKVRYTYKRNLCYLEDEFGRMPLHELVAKGLVIKRWLEGDLSSVRNPGEELSFQSRKHLRVLLSQLLNFAVLRGDIAHNPFNQMRLLTRGGKRPVDRSVFEITPEMFRWMQLDPETPAHVKMMQLVSYCMGLRGDEFLGLMWSDISFDSLEPVIHIQRGVVGKDIQLTKTSESEAKLPMCDMVGAALLCFKDECPPVNGWVFGSMRTGRPFHLGILTTDHLRPALLRMAAKFKLKGVPKGTGFHSFRHNFRKLMDELNSPLEVQQRLMRHADEAMTKHYGKQGWAIKRRMREVHTSVADLAMGRAAN
jgi:integrase